jgi:hypothetical protein
MKLFFLLLLGVLSLISFSSNEAVGLEVPIEKIWDELPEGILIFEIMENYGAEKAGLLVGDVVVTINGKSIHNMLDLPSLSPGEIANIEALRDGEKLEFNVEIMPNPDNSEKGLIGYTWDDSVIYDKIMEHKSSSEEIKSFSELKLLEGQWVEYDFKMKFEGDGSAATKIIENVMLQGLQESNTLNFNPFEITKLRLEVFKVTDYTVILKYVMTLQGNEVLKKNYFIHPDSTADLFNSVFIQSPTSKEFVFINTPTKFTGERNIILKKMEIPTFLYTGYETKDKTEERGMIVSYNSEINFEKYTGILLKSTRTENYVGNDEFFEGITYQLSTEQSLTDYYIPNQNNLEKTESSPDMIDNKSIINPEPNCGVGTILKDGMCVVNTSKITSKSSDVESSKGGGCLIATATYGSELAPEVQKLRELRDNSLLNTESGTNFMNLFNDVYYSFSPVIADYERENPVFKEMVKVAITPMLTSLSILNYVDMDSESKVLGYGISLIMLNAMMYLGIPLLAVMRFRK